MPLFNQPTNQPFNVIPCVQPACHPCLPACHHAAAGCLPAAGVFLYSPPVPSHLPAYSAAAPLHAHCWPCGELLHPPATPACLPALLLPPCRFTAGHVFNYSEATIRTALESRCCGSKWPKGKEHLGPNILIFFWNFSRSQLHGPYCR